MARKIIILTEEEYKSMINEKNIMLNEIKNLREELKCLEGIYEDQKCRSESLYKKLKKQIIEEFYKKQDEDFYNWCESIAAKYEELDYSR